MVSVFTAGGGSSGPREKETLYFLCFSYMMITTNKSEEGKNSENCYIILTASCVSFSFAQ